MFAKAVVQKAHQVHTQKACETSELSPAAHTARCLTAAQMTAIHQCFGADRNWLARTNTRVQFHLV